tara:strand:+ start:70193 stop:70906 length:714 start_codon:yes stop_codon:yes gene_type:complete
MLADHEGNRSSDGALDTNLHLPQGWQATFLEFVSALLQQWRDDPARPQATAETKLSAQLCAKLASAFRHGPWDFMQVRREEPDETLANRSIDIAVAAAGATIIVEGRRYNEYATLLPIECKRLPTPAGHERDEREYLYSQFKSTGGVQRFKCGHHAAQHSRAAMIGYVQAPDISSWASALNNWIDDLAKAGEAGWSASDKLQLDAHDLAGRLGRLTSRHVRDKGLEPIEISHLWVEM